MYVQIKKAEKYKNMKRFKKLYEYVIDIQLDYQFMERVSIDEQTKIVLFELVVLHNGEEDWLIKDTKPLDIEWRSWKIKDFLLGIIEVEITNENIHNKTIEQIENGFVVNGKEFLLKDRKYADLREKVLKEVKEYALH